MLPPHGNTLILIISFDQVYALYTRSFCCPTLIQLWTTKATTRQQARFPQNVSGVQSHTSTNVFLTHLGPCLSCTRIAVVGRPTSLRASSGKSITPSTAFFPHIDKYLSHNHFAATRIRFDFFLSGISSVISQTPTNVFISHTESDLRGESVVFTGVSIPRVAFLVL